MKRIFTLTLIPLTIIVSSFNFAQEIDPSLLDSLSPSQIEMARAEISKVKQPISQPKPIVTESTIKTVSDNDINFSDGKKYGYSYFSSIPTSISAVGDLPLPSDYKISLKDQFTVILSGSKEGIFDLNVNLDGTILFPGLGSISVVGETFQDVKIKLRNLIDQSYIGAQIDLSLKNLSAKKITIVGAVKTPGTYLVNPFSTISSALGYSGGVSEIGTLRNIRLVRSNGETFYFDLYKLLIDGDRSDDITIESGDVIVIDPAEDFIYLKGEVKRPAIYEIKDSENLEDLIAFGLGFTKSANKSNINLRVLDIDSASIKTTNVSNIMSDLNDVIGVIINSYNNKNIASVSISGAVKEPGFYNLKENETLESLIGRLEFVNVYPWLAILEQFDEENLIKSTILFNLNDRDTFKSIKVLPNSRLYFADLNEKRFNADQMSIKLIEDYFLVINHKQGSFNLPVFGKYSVKSFVDLLGLDMSDVENEATYISPLENIVIKDDYRNMRFSARKYNTVSFRSPINDLIRVSISGAVDYPGTYTLKAGSTVEDLYGLIGDFKNEAFYKGIVFTRESVRERQVKSLQQSRDDLNKALLTNVQKGSNIGDLDVIRALSDAIEPEYLGRIAGDFSPESDSTERTILFNGDSLIVPRNPNVINVLGEVLNPIAFEYRDRVSVRSAITSAGGFQDTADKRKVYVIKANGIIEQKSRNIFAGNSNLEPGDTVIVPRKIFINSPGIQALLPITQILSDLAFSTAAIETLVDNN